MLESFLSPSRPANVVLDVDFNGLWNNQHGSEMTLQVQQGRVIGKVGAPQPAEEFDLVGFCSGDLIAFTVNFGKHGSLTAWAGQVAGKPPDEGIQTLWYLAKNVRDPDEPKELWAGVLAGADVFRRGSHP